MIKLKKPYEFVLFHNNQHKIGFFKLDKEGYIAVGGCQIVDLEQSLLDNDDKIIITGDNVIPLIAYHNWRLDLAAVNLKSMGRGGKHKEIVMVRNSIIDEDININATDLVNKYMPTVPDADYEDFVNTRDLYIKIINDLLK